MPDRKWFALAVRSCREHVVSAALAHKGYEILLPTYRSRRPWSDRIKELELPLFPGYVFCRFNHARRTAPVVSTPGVIRIIGFGGEPAPLDNAEINAVRLVQASLLAAQPYPYVASGSRVRVTHGSLSGIEGIVVSEKKHHQLVVSITLLQRSVAVAIDRAWVTPTT